jgi:hypothetical protein
MEELSRLLPDTTWVQQLDVKSGSKSRELQLAGETGSSSQLIEVLERSGTFANASFKSPLTKGVTPGTERFLLAAEVKPRPLPEPVPEDALAATAAVKAQARPAAASPLPPAAAPAAPATAPATAVVTPVSPPARGSSGAYPPPAAGTGAAKPAASGEPEGTD